MNKNSRGKAWSAYLAVFVLFFMGQSAWSQNEFSYGTGFELADGYSAGVWTGGQGWQVQGSVELTNPAGWAGGQALRLNPSVVPPQLTFQADPAAAASGVAFVDLQVRPVAQELAGLQAPTGVSSAVYFALVGSESDPVARFYAAEGNGLGSGTWVASGRTVPISGGVTSDWLRLTYRLDYTSHTWDFYVNGVLEMADIGFLNNQQNRFERFVLLGDKTKATHFDHFEVGPVNPLFLDADHDGINDAYEVANGMNPGFNDRNADLDGDGLSNLEEYMSGTRADLADTDGDGVNDATELAAGTDPLSGLPYIQNFESFSAGDVFQAPHWSLDGTGTGLVQQVTPSSKGLVWQAASGSTWLQAVLEPVSGQHEIVWSDLKIKPTLTDSVDLPASPSLRTVALHFNQQRNPVVLDGNTWKVISLAPTLPADSWIRVTIAQNFTTQTWDLWINGRRVGEHLAFAGYGNRFNRLTVGTGTSATSMDDISVSATEPDGLDNDGDGLTNAQERALGSNPDLTDSDGDTMPDAWEVANGLNPAVADGNANTDGDLLTAAEEYALGLNPNLADTDGNGDKDGYLMPGKILWETWDGIGSGNDVRDLIRATAYSENVPTKRAFLTALEGPRDRADSYGSRMRGFIVPTVSGDYTFWLSGDNQCELWLSGNTSKFGLEKLAWVNTSTDYRAWDANPSQKSRTVQLQAGQRYYFQVLHKEGSGYDHLSVAWTPPGLARDVIGATNLVSWQPDPNDVDDDQLPDDWEVAHFGDIQIANLGGDPDGDGLSNLQEWAMGSDPLKSDTDEDGLSDLQESFYGLNPNLASDAAMATSITPWQATDINSTRAGASDRIGSAIGIVSWGTKVGAKSDSVRFLYQDMVTDFELVGKFRFTGDSPSTAYTGLMVRRDLPQDSAMGAVMVSPYGDLQTVMRMQNAGQALATFQHLHPAGDYWLKARRRGSELVFFKSTNGQSWYEVSRVSVELGSTVKAGMALMSGKADVPAGVMVEQVWLWQDSDRDGIVDEAETTQGTSAQSPDSDGDSITDYDEQFETFTNPHVADLTRQNAGTPATGDRLVPVLGGWEQVGEYWDCDTQNGTLDFEYDLPGGNVYLLEIAGVNQGGAVSEALFHLSMEVDGHRIGMVDIKSAVGESATGRIFTPWLPAGRHRFRIKFANYESFNKFRLETVSVQTLGGEDANNNGIADWVERRLTALNTLDVPATSPTSPVCVEGHAYVASMATMGGIAVRPAPSGKWFQDVALDPDGPVNVAVSFENGGAILSKGVEWSVTHIPGSQGRVVRKGDAFKFSPVAVGAPDAAGIVRIKNSANSTVAEYNTGAGSYAVHRFETAGGFAVESTVNGVVTSFHVDVVDANLGEPPLSWVGLERKWRLSGLSSLVQMQADNRIGFEELPPDTSSRWFALFVDRPEPRYVAARAGEDGPILACVELPSVAIASTQRSYVKVVQVLPDGTRVVETSIVVSNFYEGMRFDISLLASGVVFDDGTLFCSLVRSDFNENGELVLRMLMSPDAVSNVCHNMVLYQNNTAVGIR